MYFCYVSYTSVSLKGILYVRLRECQKISRKYAVKCPTQAVEQANTERQ